MRSGTTEQAEALRPYVPRFLIRWLRDDPTRRVFETDGSLAFVDISGFTKMCERLARRGKVGAEEINDVLDTCFTQLLSLAYEDGGGVLKWGGDAVLLLFTGPDHTARAARAAHRMRARLREIGRRLRTSAGLVSLRMSVGIHSGTFHLFLVGERHRELVITGPGATRTVAMESIATAGEIALSPEAAALLDPRALGATKGEARLLRSEPTGIPFSPRQSDEELGDVDLSSLIPLGIRDHLRETGAEAEHRQVAVAFLEFLGVDALLEREGAEAVWSALDHLIRGVQQAALDHEVTFFETDISANGGKVMLVSGAPQSAGNDEERILRTGRAVLDRGGVLPVRIGVNAGHVFAGVFGPPYRRTYSIKGDAVNLAARVMGKAAPGQLLATVPVVERSLTVFDLEPMEPFMVKGKKRPVQAFAVGQVVGTKAAGWLDLPLVGRDAEMMEILRSLESARRGRGGLVEIVGEPGIGKSRLVQEARAQAPDVEAVAAACDPYESSTAYFPVRILLRRVLGIPLETEPGPAGHRLEAEVRSAAPELLPWLPLLAMPLGAEADPTEEVDRLDLEFRKARLEQATGELLTSLVRGPTLLILEDVHWMDEPSADLVRHLASLAPQRPWLIVATRRDQPTGFLAQEEPGTVTIRPAPLSASQSAALATAAREESPLPPHAIAALAERSGGNPLFLQELVSAAEGAGSVEALPDSIEGVLTALIDRLPAADRTMLRYASVLGATFDERLLNSVMALERNADDGVWRRLGEYLSIDSAGTYRFRHALIRDVAYEGLPYRRRREIHARVGETLELWAGDHRHDQAEALSLHFYQAGRYEEAWEYSRVAGDRAQAKYANVEASDLYRRALDAGRRAGSLSASDLARVHEALGDVAERAGLYHTAADAYREARRTARGQAVPEAALLLKEGLIRERAGRYSDAVAWYGRGLRALPRRGLGRTGLAIRARISVWYASSRRQQGRYDEAVDWCRRAIDDATASDERAALAHAYRILDLLYTKLGRPERLRYRDLALPIYEELGDLAGMSEVLNDLGTDAYFEGRWEEALELYRRSTEARRKTGDEANAAHGTNNRAEILSDQGHLEEADALFREVWRIWKAAGYLLPLAYAISNRGRVAARAGRHEEADRSYREALEIFRSKQAEWEILETETRMAENALLAGRPQEALARVAPALQRVESLGGLPVLRAMLHRIRGYALTASDAAAAAAELKESLACARSADARYEVALTLMAQAHLAAARGLDGSIPQEEARRILGSLGVVSLPEPPVLAAAQA